MYRKTKRELQKNEKKRGKTRTVGLSPEVVVDGVDTVIGLLKRGRGIEEESQIRGVTVVLRKFICLD